MSIILTVLPNEAVTIYDFTIGVGSDKWVFRKQHFNTAIDTGTEN
ncbi:MAG: hypothetical protein ACT6FD_06910 [Methanosarcinaceae archaeon]